MNNHKLRLSVIVPVYNEEQSIEQVISSIKNELGKHNFEYEVLVVNDGSTDRSRNILESIGGISLINHPYNKGYGASLKTGAKNANFEWLLFFDGDGQHMPEYIPELLKYAGQYDMVVGARKGYKGPWTRQPGKKFLSWIANYLVDFKIPDLNSGLRIVKKDAFWRFAHLYPDGFSLSTTITLSFIKGGFNVRYVPISINKRGGTSMVKPRDAFLTLMLIIRMITLFSPLKFFIPITFFFFFLVIISVSYDFIRANLTDTSVVLFISTILFFFLGIILDMVASIRRDFKGD